MRKHNLVSLILFILYLAALAWCCFGNFDDLAKVQKSFFGIATDKVVHFIMFFPFPILCFQSFSFAVRKQRTAFLATILVFFLGCLVAAGTEIGQSYTSYRSGDPMDFGADVLSMAISSVLCLICYLIYRKKS